MTLNMDGPKRLQLTTIEPPGKKEKKGLTKVTVRFDLDLVESTDSVCPEFFYPDLLKTQPQDAEKKSTSDDPFGDDEDEEKLAAIARAFEEKYNKPGEGGKKKKKAGGKGTGMQFMYDLGDGYDENDTFIDNSEAYDEYLPYDMTTKLGGFYINSGTLHLKEMSEDSEDEFTPKSVKKNKKKRMRISSDDDSGAEEKVVKKKKIKEPQLPDGEAKKRKKKKLQLDGEKPFKKPKQPQDKEKQKQTKSASVAALIKSTSPNLNGESQENGVSSQESGDSNESDSVKASYTEAIDAVISMATKDDSNSQSDFVEEQKKEIDPESIPKLPANLGVDIESKLAELKKQAKELRDGKTKFFSPSVNKILLDVEMSTKGMTVSNRSSMYAHLAAFLPCSKETLLKRAKSLRVKELEDKIKEPLEKLRQAVNRMMPGVQEKYEAEYKKHAEERAEGGNKEAVEKEVGKEEANTESDEEEKTAQSTDSTKKRVVGPRKKFPWDNNLRSLLGDVVRVKMHTYQMSRARSQTAEEFCKAFLDQDVRPLWPKGWMQMRILYKESKPAHAPFTNPQKTKKAMLVTKTAAAVSSQASTNQTNRVSPAVTPMSSMNGSKTVMINVSKLNSGAKSATPMFVNNNKGPTVTPSSVNSTPNTAPKSLVPTILDYTDVGPGASKQGGTAKLASPSNISKSVPNSSAMNLATSGANLKSPNDSKVPSNPKPTEKWDHIVSDILRSSINEQLMKSTSPTAAAAAAKQNSFHSQFETFTANLLNSQGIPGQKNVSPTQSLSNAQILAIQRGKTQLKAIQDQLMQEKRRVAQQQQQMPSKPQTTVAKTQPNQSVVKTQPNQSGVKLQQPNQSGVKMQPNQSGVKMQPNQSGLKMQPNQSGVKVQPNQSGLKMQLNQSGIKLQQNQSGQKTQPNPFGVNIQTGNQSKAPSQSPMSLAMSKSLGSSASGQKITPKQLVTQFPKEPNKTVTLLTENMIRQQLSGTKTSPATVMVNTKTGTKTNPVVVGSPYGQVVSSPEVLRKASPQSQALNLQVQTAQVKTSAPQVVKAQPSQGSPNSMFLKHGSLAVTSDNKVATTLLKTLFGQAQSSTPQIASHEAAKKQAFIRDLEKQKALLQAHAANQAKSIPKVVQQQSSPKPGQSQWSPTSTPPTPTRTTFPGSGTESQPKPYMIPPTAAARPVPGYQSVKLPSMTADKIYPAVPQAHRSPESGLFGNQVSRPSPGPHSPHITQEQHRYSNTLHFGYHSYQDGSK